MLYPPNQATPSATYIHCMYRRRLCADRGGRAVTARKGVDSGGENRDKCLLFVGRVCACEPYLVDIVFKVGGPLRSG